ncbi:hypothetical protein HF325_006228 [Metschnikowia pulcherrima]|uniref:Uncharacterized protein n=1 Tax=Metschnikowia pulcherrima TaxID=27326 RepID=A0A8H7GM90_9ASCO|nr:hypothetical protein HF325_006228 [Metschnikowia pulcherrima]
MDGDEAGTCGLSNSFKLFKAMLGDLTGDARLNEKGVATNDFVGVMALWIDSVEELQSERSGNDSESDESSERFNL